MSEIAMLPAKMPEANKETKIAQTQKTDFSNSTNSSVDRILFLQRTIGNQAIQRLIKSGTIQAKLRIGQPGDVYEQEADRVAEQVMRMPDISGQASGTKIQRKCPRCREDKKDEKLQAKVVSDHTPEVTPQIEANINALKGGGQPLPESTRAFYEERFGHDFSQVRVHTDAKAAESARAMNAMAYTVGRDVVFGEGQYVPSTYAGRKLLAHELTHVVQQRGMQGAEIHIGSQEYPARRDGQDAAECALRGDFPSIAAAARWAHDTAQRQVADDEDERHQISVITESHTPILQRQDFPPPPPPYPHFTEMFFGDVAAKIGELEITCDDMRERGFYIFWDVNTKKAYPGDIEMGDPAPKECTKPAQINFPPMPRDRGNILVGGFFHNHPPVWPGCAQIEVGPSKKDKDTSSRLKLPGLVQDFVSPGPNTTCKGNPRGTFFFGPPRREI
ncbi:MAG: DUF4157 domain-containing protein [Candidatus Methanoperedens sp.]